MDASRLPLDPILTPGVFIRPPKTTFAQTAWRVISDPDYFRKCVLREHVPAFLATPASYREHIKLLEDWKVLEGIDASQLKHACRYFAVPKFRGSEITARTIFDGRSLNSCCWKPPPVNIPDPVEVGRFVAHMVETHGENVGLYLADFRHYFHQIPVNAEISRFFGVKCGNFAYIWRSLAMGFSWAPFIAQALGIGLLAEATREFAVRDYMKDSGIPRYLDLRHNKLNATARVYLTYDNVAVISSCTQFTQLLQQRIVRRLKQSRIVIKEEERIDSLLLDARSDVSGNHLGAQYASRDGVTLIRIAPDTVGRWTSSVGKFSSLDACGPIALTRRQLARVCGVIIHSQRIRQHEIHDNQPLLSAIRSIYPLEGGWEAETTCDSGISRQLALALKNEWSPICGYKQHTAQPEAVIASDACGTGVGYIIHTKNGSRTFSSPTMFPKVDNPNQFIFVKEVLAATLALEAAGARGIKSAVLLIDNSAGASAIRNGFSNNPLANELIKRIRSLNLDLRVVAIPGISNPADAPSRGEATQVDRLKVLDDVLKHPDYAPILAKQQYQQPLLEDEAINDSIEDALADIVTSNQQKLRFRSEKLRFEGGAKSRGVSAS